MAQTYNPTISLLSYALTGGYSYAAGPVISGTMNLSAESMLASPPLSGTTGFSTCIFAYRYGLTTGNITLTSAPLDLKLSYPSNTGPQDIYGYLTTSTITTATSNYQVTVQFQDPNFFGTVLVLSGSRTTALVLTASSQIDNPIYTTLNTVSATYQANTNQSALTSNNLSFKTVGGHVRTWNLNG